MNAKPTRAQREVLEALRDGAEIRKLTYFASGQVLCYYIKNNCGGNAVRLATFAILGANGWLEETAREPHGVIDYTISAAGREAIADKGGE